MLAGASAEDHSNLKLLLHHHVDLTIRLVASRSVAGSLPRPWLFSDQLNLKLELDAKSVPEPCLCTRPISASTSTAVAWP